MKRWSTSAIALLVVGFAVVRYAPEASGQADAGWITLLEGSKMGDWDRIGDANWRVDDGAVVADKKEAKESAFLVSKSSYKDFQIRAEFWADEEANSGIFIRCDDPKKVGAKSCYEVNIFDKRPDPIYGTGAITGLAKVEPMPKAAGKWNTYEITAQGTHLVVVLDGVKTVDVEDGTHASGPFALQYASGVIKFRKVQIKPL